MDTISFLQMKGFKPGDTAVVDALQLQEMLSHKRTLESKVLTLNNKLEKCYDENEKLLKNLVAKDNKIKELYKMISSMEELVNEAKTIARENVSLKDRVNLSKAVLEIKREKELSFNNNIKVDLRA